MFALNFIRWAIHLNVTVIPRSRDPRHILLNFKTLDIELSQHEIKLITEEWLPTTSKGSEEESESLGTSNDNAAASERNLGTREDDDGNNEHVTSDVDVKDEL